MIEKLVLVVDVAVCSDWNVALKEAEKIKEYKDLAIELSSLWKMKCEVIPIVIGGQQLHVC